MYQYYGGSDNKVSNIPYVPIFRVIIGHFAGSVVHYISGNEVNFGLFQ